MEQLLKKLRDLNIVISIEGRDLKIGFNGSGLPAELISELKENKEKIVNYLSGIEAVNSEEIRPQLYRESYALSSSQSRVWVLSQFEGDSHAYNMPGVYVFEGHLDPAALEASLKALMARHEILRTYFRDDALGEIRQFIYPEEDNPFVLSVMDFRGLSDKEQVLKEEVQKEIITPFNLSSRPLLRARLFRMEEHKWVFTYVIHHIVCDGWSMNILFQELAVFYNAAISNSAADLRPLRIHYKDYAFWQNQLLSGATLQAHRSYWQEKFSGEIPVLSLPGDHPRPAVKNHHGDATGRRINAALAEGLKKICNQQEATLFMGLLAVINVLLYRYTGQEDIIIGTPVAGRDHIDLEDQIGLYLNTLPLRTCFNGTQSFIALLAVVKEVTMSAYEHQVYPFEKLVDDLALKRDMSRSPLFDVMIMLQNTDVKGNSHKLQFGDVKVSGYVLSEHQVSKMDLTFDFVELEDGLQVTLEYNSDIYNKATAEQLMRHLEQLLEAIVLQPALSISMLDYIGDAEKNMLLETFNQTTALLPAGETICSLIEEQVQKTPQAIALVVNDKSYTYSALYEKVSQVSAYLRRTFDVKANDLIGIQLERDEWMVFSMLGILGSGAGYVPIDPAYPQERISYILKDSNCIGVIDTEALGKMKAAIDENDSVARPLTVQPHDIAYCIYTSGTTGMPKGCLLTHSNVVNFFYGMDQVFTKTPGTLLSLTNNTFDISVLELIWTLTKGYKVVLQQEITDIVSRPRKALRPLDFSLFYFGNADTGRHDEKYKLLLDGARYADENGYAAIWTPERHFHEFGGLYPNPAILGAALAAITSKVSIRAGSVVVPLHHPLRIAEEWSVVDNLSGGRVGIACASGWHARDFVLSPASYANRHAVMYEHIRMVQGLWKGDTIAFEDGTGHQKATAVFPRPIQQELPIWITSANSIDTFITAGKMGAGVLTHLLGETVEGLAVKINAYRKAFAESGHDATKQKVALMLHAFVGEDEASTYESARQPFMNYLRTSAGLMKNFAADLNMNIDAENFSEEDMQSLLEHAYSRYVSSASLIGSRENCFKMLEKLSDIGVDEIACLIDFGVPYQEAMQSLENITALKSTYAKALQEREMEDYAVHTQLLAHQVSHLQVTPSMAMLLRSETGPLRSLKKLLLGGERVHLSLVKDLYAELPDTSIYNMYGPTETTIWSATCLIDRHTEKILIGKPILNTQIYILDAHMQLLPMGAEGEICIGGRGVAAGYINKPALSAQRFVPDPFRPGERLYRTGDFGRWLPDGNIEYLGRRDDQVKLHGHRIELKEIEAALLHDTRIDDAVVLVKESPAGEKTLVAWFVAKTQLTSQQIREALANKLPGYMLPQQCIQLSSLPLTFNGKIDRKQLLQSDITPVKPIQALTMAENEVETKLLEIWELVLERQDIGTTDNFFDLGGSSIKIVRMVMLCNREFDRKLTVAMAFRFTNIRALAAYLYTGHQHLSAESEQELDKAVDIMEDTFTLLNENAHES
ncbi:MupA/Atu3671 family FMN-dependent luciferase-like monooxygenase [Chitinophaga sp.]|uniref:MupA/Atu3671 family FMN-dependent luciferase-like monooxygenase n=1 Tax=Chitinophaga sp. TaxID=1869181 RepID=UPI0031D3D32E